MAGSAPLSLTAPARGPAADATRHDERVSSRPGSWFDAWVAAAYGPTGFWPASRPAAHFRTASNTGPELAQALLALLDAHPGIERVLEVGAGHGHRRGRGGGGGGGGGGRPGARAPAGGPPPAARARRRPAPSSARAAS